MLCVDYGYYKGIYGGTAIQQEQFDHVMRQAIAHVNRATLGRALDQPDDVLYKIKDACCAVAEMLYKSVDGAEVASETVGKWSRTYATSGKSTAQRVRSIVAPYLMDTGLMYRGC